MLWKLGPGLAWGDRPTAVARREHGVGPRKLWCLLSILIGVGAAYLAFDHASALATRLVPMPDAALGVDGMAVALAMGLAAFGLVGGGLLVLGLGVADVRAVGGAVDRLRRLDAGERRAGAEILHCLGNEPALHTVTGVAATWLRTEAGTAERERRPLGPLSAALVSDGLRYRRLVPYGAGLLVLAGIVLTGFASLDTLPGFAAAGDQPATLAAVAVRLAGAALALLLPAFAAALLMVCHLGVGEALANSGYQLTRVLANVLPLAEADLTLRQLDRSVHDHMEALVRGIEGGYADLSRQIEAATHGAPAGAEESSVARDLGEIRSLVLALGSDLRANTGRIGEAMAPLGSVGRDLRDVLHRLQDLAQRLAETPIIAAEASPVRDAADPADFAQAIEELVVENEQAVRRLPRI